MTGLHCCSYSLSLCIPNTLQCSNNFFGQLAILTRLELQLTHRNTTHIATCLVHRSYSGTKMPVAVGAPSMFNIRTWLIRVEGLLLIAFLYHTNGNLISTWQCLGTNKFASFTWPQIFYCSVHVRNIAIPFLYVNINCDYHLRYIIHKKDKCFCVITVRIVWLPAFNM